MFFSSFVKTFGIFLSASLTTSYLFCYSFQPDFTPDAGLQVVYVALAFIGWYWWLYGGERRTKLKVCAANLPQMLVAVLAVAVITLIIQFVPLRYTDSTVAGWDAVTTALSLVAQAMLNRKLIQNWFLWITADVIYIWLYAYKGLWLTSLLYFIFLLLCIAGFIQWRKGLSMEPKVEQV